MKLPSLLRALPLAALLAGAAAQAATPCDEAWATYREFKSRTVMEASQYTLTTQAAAVRAACGKDALPAPAGADTPPRLRIRKPEGCGTLPACHSIPRRCGSLTGRTGQSSACKK